MSLLRKLGLAGASKQLPRGKGGCRAYAVGDIHGRLDLLNLLLAEIEADIAARPARRNFIIFLGDYVDRGPDSAGVIERLRSYRHSDARLIFLGGNHEEVLLNILAGKLGVLPSWLKFGGAECAESYGIDAQELASIAEEAAIKLVQAQIPQAHREFLTDLADTFSFGDYLFVHAGIRPGLPIEEQARADLRWIREPFLNDAKEHGYVVVHGHTIVQSVEQRQNRIAIDTGAYRTGVLTALAVEDEQRWFLGTSVAGSRAAQSQAA